VVWFKDSDVPRFELVVKDMHPVELNNGDEYEGTPRNLEEHSFFEVLQGRLSEAFQSEAPHRIVLTPIKSSPAITKPSAQLQGNSPSPVNTYVNDADERHSTSSGKQPFTIEKTSNVTVELQLRSGSRKGSRSPLLRERPTQQKGSTTRPAREESNQMEQRKTSIPEPSLGDWDVSTLIP
jgi:hypothetical protein